MNRVAIAGLVFLLVLVLLGGCVYQGYNQAITLDEGVKQRWAQVENQLQRRYDLIPNLVETVKGITQQEKDIFLGVAEARTKYFNARDTGTVGEQAQAASGVERALSRLLFLQEKYPELKSNESFLKLQDELAGTENRVAVERQRFNEAVEVLRAFTRRFPTSIYARLAGVEAPEYFEVPTEAKAAPKVDFSEPAAPKT